MYKPLLSVFVLIVLLASCQMTQHIADTEITYQRSVSDYDNMSDDNTISEMILPYKDEMDSQMNLVLGTLPEDLKKERPNSNMGNWFCDALLVMAEKYHGSEVDFAIQNYGGLRIPFLGKGNITKANVYELMPFDNQLIVLELNGNQLKDLLDNIASDRGWPISKGLSFKIADGEAEDILVHGENVITDKIYKVALPDYVANGGGGINFLKSIPQFNTGVFIRDVIIEYLEDQKAQSKSLTVDSSKRIF